MIIDTSVWVDFSRGADTPPVDALVRALSDGTAMTTDAVRFEVLAGSREPSADQVVAALDGCVDVRQERRTDVEAAAEIYRLCRRSGETIRSLNDCLIAAIAIRSDVPVLHDDRDFEAIARHSELQVTRG
jgi:predicted nucleic acid-binding protein